MPKYKNEHEHGPNPAFPKIDKRASPHLEGPKVHHDNHGKNASHPTGGNKDAVPCKPWEMHYNLCGASRNMELTEGSDFAPKQSDQRKTTYIKVNREDH